MRWLLRTSLQPHTFYLTEYNLLFEYENEELNNQYIKSISHRSGKSKSAPQHQNQY